ncbi:hypothetical protein CDAR_520391 [Caerostris darwini]|uniref:Transmembrane protein n=1 Tax=Caerostris darwini TaxID=1538125 RepID=A0AAV4WTL1_9ARAC|nr:hypothetical protein CDAR_520391 [Caerostris darwini]
MPNRKQWKLETMLTTMEDNVKAHVRESKRIALSKSETRAHQYGFNWSVELSSVNRLSTLTMTILNKRNVFTLFSLLSLLFLSSQGYF